MNRRICNECPAQAQKNGLCEKHYWASVGQPRPARKTQYREPCVFPGCDRISDLPGCGLCRGHYQQQYEGKPLTPLLSQLTIKDRLLKKRRIDEATGCWVWTGHVDSPGYGTFGFRGKTVKVHRVAYEAWIGEIGGDTIHHKCANRRCFNPDHLERATLRENALEMHERRALRRRIEFLEQRVQALEATLAKSLWQTEATNSIRGVA